LATVTFNPASIFKYTYQNSSTTFTGTDSVNRKKSSNINLDGEMKEVIDYSVTDLVPIRSILN
jgi:hypothetical protein